MAVTAQVFGQALTTLANKEWDWDSDDIRVVLLKAAYTPDQDAHVYLSDVIAHDVGASGDYTAGGVALSGKSRTYTGATNKTKLDANDWTVTGVTFAPAGSGFRYAVVYSRTPATDATRPLIALVDFGAEQIISSGNVTITWHANGIVELTAS